MLLVTQVLYKLRTEDVQSITTEGIITVYFRQNMTVILIIY